MFRPLQPAFKIRVFDGKRVSLETLKGTNVSAGDNYLDIEACVAFPVTYEESADLLTHLNFTVDKHAEVLLYYFFIGQSIILYGGYYADNQSTMRHVFSGTVTRIRTRFSDEGKVSFTVECMNYGFTRMGKDVKNFVYPDKKSSRSFAQKETMSVKDIIEGIAKDNNLQVGAIDLSTDARKVNFDKISVRYQKNMTDWRFLTQLAQDFGCSVWIATEDGIDKLYFMSHEKAFKKQSEISFLYPLNGVIKDVQDSEMQKFEDPAYNRPRILREVSVDEDISAAYSVSRSAMYFDKETGEYKESISKIEEDKDGNRTITFYELDESRVQYVHENLPEVADEIRDSEPASLPWGTPDNPRNASYYYVAVRHYEEHQAVFDKAFFGITANARCNQDLDIHSQRTYKIRGLLSYHSKDLTTSFFLRSLRHIWDVDGNWTELEFIR